MSKKVLVRPAQPVVGGPLYGKVSDPADFEKSQDYAHAIVETILREVLMNGGPGAKVAGFNLTLTTGLSFSVATGSAFSLLGKVYDADEAAAVLTLGAAHATLPRIDLVYLLLEDDAEAEFEFRPYIRLRTESELAAGVRPYTPEEISQPQELHTRATIQVRAGTPNASPVVPAVNANEIALYRVRVDAAAVTLTSDKVTDVRPGQRSLAQANTLIDTVQATLAAVEAIVNAATAANVPSTLVKRDANGRFGAGPMSMYPMIGPIGGTNPSGFYLETGQAIADPTELVIVSLHGAAAGGPKIALEAVPAQNCHRLKIYNNRGGSPGSDKLRYMNDESGNTHLYGPTFIHADIDASAGNLTISGTLSKAAGTFLIDHPLDPENFNLIHGFVEAPRYDLIYRGRVQLKNGEAVVDIDQASNMKAGTFAALTQNVQFLPPYNESDSWDRVRVRPRSLTDGKFILECENNQSSDFVTWTVIAERNDAYIRHTDGTDDDGHLIVEVEKPKVDAATALAPRTNQVEVDSDNVLPDETTQEVAVELIGTRGFPLHPEAIKAKRPKRKVTHKFVRRERDGEQAVKEPGEHKPGRKEREK
jgi:hypothetical protein